MSIKDIFLQKLADAGYKNKNAFKTTDFEVCLKQLEKDRKNVFHAIYGDKIITRGLNQQKEFEFRLRQAEQDKKLKMIPFTMSYILTQIGIGDLKA